MTQYYRCKCGKTTSFGSMPPPRCLGCHECGVTLAQHPDYHRQPEPHNFQSQSIDTDAGQATLTVCIWCHQTKAEIEAKAAKV